MSLPKTPAPRKRKAPSTIRQHSRSSRASDDAGERLGKTDIGFRFPVDAAEGFVEPEPSAPIPVPPASRWQRFRAWMGW